MSGSYDGHILHWDMRQPRCGNIKHMDERMLMVIYMRSNDGISPKVMIQPLFMILSIIHIDMRFGRYWKSNSFTLNFCINSEPMKTWRAGTSAVLSITSGDNSEPWISLGNITYSCNYLCISMSVYVSGSCLDELQSTCTHPPPQICLSTVIYFLADGRAQHGSSGLVLTGADCDPCYRIHYKSNRVYTACRDGAVRVYDI